MPNVFDNSRQVLINGKVVDSIVTSTGGMLYSRLLSSSLSIDVPLNLVYSDAFLINGTLTDKNNEGIVGETVKLVVGSTVVDSTTTTTNGAYSFTQTPVSTGNHTFQVVYDGNEEYSGSESSIVERVVGKETTVLSLTTPTDNSSVYTDGSIDVNGSLVTDDNEKLNNKTIVVKEGNTTITTYTTNSNGVFTGSITGLNAGTHSLTFQFVSDSNYTGSSVVRTVIVNNHSYSLSANVDQSAISLNDSVTISGVLLKDGNGYANQTVTIYDGTTNKGICTTDSNGAYSKTLTGLTEGSHSLKAVTSNAESEVKTVNVYEIVAEFTGSSITLGANVQWLTSVGNVIIDWGDGSTNTVNNPSTSLTHTYNDGLSNHHIRLIGEITSIGVSCFRNCTGLTSVVIPSSVTSLGSSCFYRCTGLTSITLPSSLTNIGSNCFHDCTGLTSVVIPSNVTYVTSLGSSCFYRCTGLTSVVIPSNVTYLGSSCFNQCTNLIDYQLYWTGNDIITYDSGKMPNNTNTIFTVPEGEIQNYINKGYPMLKLQERIITNDGIIYRKPITATFTGDYIQLGMDREYWFMPANNIVINWGDGTSNTVTPRTFSDHFYTDGKSEHTIMLIGEITSIGLGFVNESHDNLKSITIPDSIESLGDYCFLRCTGLTSIVIPNSVTNLGNGCFNKCTNLIDYQLYWTGNDIITYDSKKMPNNTNTIFTIPQGETANYTAKGYPTNKLVER